MSTTKPLPSQTPKLEHAWHMDSLAVRTAHRDGQRVEEQQTFCHVLALEQNVDVQLSTAYTAKAQSSLICGSA